MEQIELDFGVAVFSDYGDDGYLEIQEDAPGVNGKAGTVAAHGIGPGGLVHRPLDPDKDSQGTPTNGASILSMRYGDRRSTMPLNDDVRVVPKLPKVRKGGTMLYGGAEGDFYSYITVDGKDPDGDVRSGSIFASSPYLKDGSKKSHLFSMLVREAGDEAIMLIHGEGHGFTCTTSGDRAAMMKNANGTAMVLVSDKGTTITGKTKVIGSLTVGDPAAARNLVIADALITYLTALEARLATAVGAGPPTLPIASVAAGMVAMVTKGM